MAHFPFWDRYPFTNFEQLNLDYLLNETSKFSKRVEDLETITANHEVRIGTLETNVEDLTGRVGALETDVGDLKTRMTEAEGDIDNLQGRMNDVEIDVEDLEGRVSTLEDDMETAKGDITNIKGDITNIEGDIVDIHNKDQSQDNDIDALDLRVSSLESHSVVANPGGTGANLNTLSVDNVTYVIPSGGGGSGTTVTANPAGVLPTDPELSALGIDALNYRIPVTAADKAAIEASIDAIEDKVEDLEEAVLDIDTRIGTILQKTCASTIIENSLAPQANEVVELDGTYTGSTPFDSSITLTPGVYLLTFEADYDTTIYGSNARFLGGYIRNKTTHEILARGKFSVFGNERAMITQAASINCMTAVVVPEGETLTIVAAVRCNGVSPSTHPPYYTINNLQFNAVRLGVVS